MLGTLECTECGNGRVHSREAGPEKEGFKIHPRAHRGLWLILKWKPFKTSSWTVEATVFPQLWILFMWAVFLFSPVPNTPLHQPLIKAQSKLSRMTLKAQKSKWSLDDLTSPQIKLGAECAKQVFLACPHYKALFFML